MMILMTMNPKIISDKNLPVFLSYYKDVYVMTVPSPDIFLLFYIRLYHSIFTSTMLHK